MSQSPGQQERGDKGYQLFLSFSERTRDFFVTIVGKRDGIDVDDYLTAFEERIRGSHFVWRGFFKAVSQDLSVKLAVSMDEKEIGTSLESEENLPPKIISVKSGVNRSTESLAAHNSGTHLNTQQGYQAAETNTFYVNLKSGSVEHREQFDKEKTEESNFGESRRFSLLADCNASRINLALTVKDGKHLVLKEKVFVDLLDFNTKPKGEKSAVENPIDDP